MGDSAEFWILNPFECINMLQYKNVVHFVLHTELYRTPSPTPDCDLI